MKKRVLVWETLSTVSGGQKMTLNIMDMLSDHFEFFCLIPNEGRLSEELKNRGIKYALMGNQSLPAGVKGKSVILQYGIMSLKNICKSINEIRKFKPDVLYAPGPAALPWSAVCGFLFHKPVIWHLHHIFLDGPTKKLINTCGEWNAVKKIVAVSKCVGNQIENEKANAKIEILYNPVDVCKYENGNFENIKEEFEWISKNKKTLVIGHIGLIQKTKKQSFVLDIINKLSIAGGDVIGLFPGETREEAYLKYLKEKAKKLAIDNKVIFLGRRNDIPDLLKIIDILIIPSFEGFPLAGLEAISAKVPVVACDVAGAKEFIEVTHGGMTYAEDDVEDAIRAIKEIINDKENVTESGYQFALKSSYKCYKENIEKVFDYIQ